MWLIQLLTALTQHPTYSIWTKFGCNKRPEHRHVQPIGGSNEKCVTNVPTGLIINQLYQPGHNKEANALGCVFPVSTAVDSQGSFSAH